MKTLDLTSEHRHVRVYEAAASATAPVVYFIDYNENGEALLHECDLMGCPPFNLAFISHLNWDAELTPWRATGRIISPNDDFAGGAADLLQVITTDIVPRVEATLGWQPTWRVLGGYSLSGLFAVYAAFNTSVFHAIVSASGSMWYPGIVDYVNSHAPAPAVQRAYLSVGDKETRPRHPYLKNTLDNTRQIEQLLHDRGITTHLDLNPGNHFTQVTWRQARGIHWVLSPE